MALNELTLSTIQGVKGRPFEAEIIGLTGGLVDVLSDKGAPGFAVINDRLRHEALPYSPSAVVLREYDPGEGYRDTRILIDAAEQHEIADRAAGLVPPARKLTRWMTASVLSSYTLNWLIIAVDDLGTVYMSEVAPPHDAVSIVLPTAQWDSDFSATGDATGWPDGSYDLEVGITVTIADGIYTASGVAA